jgi:hypothetical protein
VETIYNASNLLTNERIIFRHDEETERQDHSVRCSEVVRMWMEGPGQLSRYSGRLRAGRVQIGSGDTQPGICFHRGKATVA